VELRGPVDVIVVGHLPVEIPLVSVLPSRCVLFVICWFLCFGANTFCITIQLSRLVAASQLVIARIQRVLFPQNVPSAFTEEA